MAGSDEIQSAYRVESSLKVTWLQVMEAEERTALLERMIKHGLSTGDVRKEVRKQEMSAQLSDVSRTDQSQARTDAKGRRD